MSSTFTWLDTSENDRRRALDVIDLFSLQGTRDELGIGVIRDALSDQLSPGTSTLQTRARYFLFIPWIYLAQLQKGTSPSNIARRLRIAELRLIAHLAETEHGTGTIGIAAGRALKRFASSIYWNGLGVWGIRLFPGSQERYHAAFGRSRPSRRTAEPEAEPEQIDWHPHIPDPPEDFPWEVTFDLTEEEAEYLRDRLRARADGSLLAFLVDAGEIGPNTDHAWDHPFLKDAPPKLQQLVEHAQNFSELLHGAALLYNLMLAEKKPLEEKIDDYQTRLHKWAQSVSSRSRTYTSWDRDHFWHQVRSSGRLIPHPTRAFCDTWTDLVLEATDPAQLVDDQRARDLIQDRERRLKRHRARLLNREYLDLWGGAAGTDRLDFRWPITKAYVRDILTPLVTREEGHAATA